MILCFFLLKNRAGARGIQDSKFKIADSSVARNDNYPTTQNNSFRKNRKKCSFSAFCATIIYKGIDFSNLSLTLHKRRLRKNLKNNKDMEENKVNEIQAEETQNQNIEPTPAEQNVA